MLYDGASGLSKGAEMKREQQRRWQRRRWWRTARDLVGRSVYLGSRLSTQQDQRSYDYEARGGTWEPRPPSAAPLLTWSSDAATPVGSTE